MPELPEAESARALIEERGLGREIVEVDDTDTYVCRPHAPGELAAALVGRRLSSAHRQGKSLWVETAGDGPVLGLHLGMAGRIVIDDHAAGDYASDGGRKHLPVWDRFTLHFADGGRLALRDKRRLGRAVLDPDLSRLGPDAALVDRETFRRRVGAGEGPLKARIMDQSVIAGIGNLLADEALWRARLDPRRPAGGVDDGDLDRLRREIRATTRRAIERGGVHTGDLIPHRRRDGVCPRCGADMARATVGGRTTYWCSAEQV
ncbi:MAG: formamidopyrimidine-DNA glycosylase [Baekduia sp.]|jgi:formamidopyrimidine-DNA glycosylase|nr:formamidopyrimidine-DNA glycosylase [Baekduia sp.]